MLRSRQCIAEGPLHPRLRPVFVEESLNGTQHRVNRFDALEHLSLEFAIRDDGLDPLPQRPRAVCERMQGLAALIDVLS